MKTRNLILAVTVISALFIGGCGYYWPHVYEGPNRTVYMPNWKNRTNRLGLDFQIYQSLSRWFQKSEAITLTKSKEQADLILAGEVISIDVPGVSWNASSSATSIKAKLMVRYVLKDLKSGEILWEVPKQQFVEDYDALSFNSTAEQEALDLIIEDMSERIYLGTLERIREQNLTTAKAQ